MPLRPTRVDELTIRGERAFRPIREYAALKRLLVADGFRFGVPETTAGPAHHDRVLFLNLTYWHAGESNDVLADASIDADVLAHAAWHHAARKVFATESAPTSAALFFGEAVASAFDIYVVGRMLQANKRTDYLATQVPAMTVAALDAGLSDAEFTALLLTVAEDPDRAFADLRELLFDAALVLVDCTDLKSAAAGLDSFRGHRFVSLLHHFSLSSWVLYAKAHAGPAVADDPVYAQDRAMRAAPVALDWLAARWLS